MLSTLAVPFNSNDHIRGNEYASVTLLEYGDYQCPHCRGANLIVHQLWDYFDDNMCYVFRHFPLRSIHPYAQIAAEAAEFAGSRGKFWPMHDLIFESQYRLSEDTLLKLGSRLEFRPSDMQYMLENGIFESIVREDFLSGLQSGVNSTPTFFINGERHRGSYAFSVLASAIYRQLMAVNPGAIASGSSKRGESAYARS
jgi:protein-disulfide isomerase